MVCLSRQKQNKIKNVLGVTDCYIDRVHESYINNFIFMTIIIAKSRMMEDENGVKFVMYVFLQKWLERVKQSRK